MAKRTTKTATSANRPLATVSNATNTEGAPSAGSVAPIAGPDPVEGASSSTNVEASAFGVQTTETGKVADAGVTVAASVTDPTTEISGDLPSATGEVRIAQPEPMPVEGGASSSSAEASIATAQATETGQAAGEGVTDIPPVTDPTSDPEPEPMIRITSRKDGFRRAGLRHGKEPRDYPVSDFTDEQLDLLEGEPNLTVEYI